MARVFELAAEASRIFGQYSLIHDQVFGFSLRGLLGTASGRRALEHRERRQQLETLAEQIREVASSTRDLEDSELTKRSKEALRSALLDYAAALETSIVRLHEICHRLHCESEGVDGYSGYAEHGLRSDKIAYDDSIQAYKRLGARLTELFHTL